MLTLKYYFLIFRSSCMYFAPTLIPDYLHILNTLMEKHLLLSTLFRHQINQVWASSNRMSWAFHMKYIEWFPLFFHVAYFLYRCDKWKCFLHLPECYQPSPLWANLPASCLQSSKGTSKCRSCYYRMLWMICFDDIFKISFSCLWNR